ncbi:hypothetical protein V8C86DRAFT_275083 [Haematococcus lacustris]
MFLLTRLRALWLATCGQTPDCCPTAQRTAPLRALSSVPSDPTRHGTARHDTTRHDTTRHDTTRHDTTRHDTTRHDTTRHDTTRHDRW